MLDILIKAGNLFLEEGSKDLGIKDGRIVLKETDCKKESKIIINAEDKLIIPGFIESHTHLDKALTIDRIKNTSGTLEERIDDFTKFFEKVDSEDVYHRAFKILKMAIVNGTTVVRSHITVNSNLGLKAMKAVLKLKEELKDYITLQFVAFPGSLPRITDENIILLRKSLKMGAGLIGGCPNLSLDYKNTTDRLFELAKEYGVDIDFHVDESDEPDVRSLEYLADKTIKEDYVGKVTAGHCCSLAAVDEKTADRVIEKVKAARINIITLPSCNMYLMGRKDVGLIRRGVTRARDFLEAGVNIAYASDNIRDLFRPFGNADMLEEGLFTAQVLQYGEPAGFKTIMKMATYYPAKILGLPDYGLDIGDRADLVVLDASNVEEALINQCIKLYVIKNGKIVARNLHQSKIEF